jgi:FtsZ-binding cell division protein ZapB
MEKIDERIYKVICDKLAKTRQDYNDLKDKNAKLEVENRFLNKEIKMLKAENIKLLKFQEKKEKITNKIKKILAKIDNLKGI